ncbi:MAG: hypothetical protein H5T69_02180 [Chloroflexi bacterium]|nr:hypothetical protein [Chloroflexota bacterium]
MEDELDIVRYVDQALRYWWLLLLCVAVAVGITLLWLKAAPEQHQARILVAITGETTQVSFDTAIATIPDSASAREARAQRLASYTELASSPAIAQAVIAELGNTLPNGYREPGRLVNMVSGALLAKSDVIEIKVTGRDRDVVTMVAEAWGRHYVRFINQIYGSVGGENAEAIRAEIQNAQEALDAQQRAYEEFLQGGRLEALNTQLQEVQSAIDQVRRARELDLQRRAEQALRLQVWLEQARDLYAQLETGGEDAAATAEPALLWLKTQAYSALPSMVGENTPIGSTTYDKAGSSAKGTGILSSQVLLNVGGSPSPVTMNLQTQPGAQGLSAERMKRDLQALIEVLETRYAQMAQETQQLLARLAEGGETGSSTGVAESPGFLIGSPQALAKLEARAGTLRAERAGQEFALHELETRRDLAQETLDNLLRKEAELSLASRTSGAQVRLASAVPVVRRQRPDTTRPLALAVLLGVAASAVLAGGIELYRNQRRQATASG